MGFYRWQEKNFHTLSVPDVVITISLHAMLHPPALFEFKTVTGKLQSFPPVCVMVPIAKLRFEVLPTENT